MDKQILGYELIDGQNGDLIKTYKAHQRNTASRRQDKLDNIHGSYRYQVKPIWGDI